MQLAVCSPLQEPLTPFDPVNRSRIAAGTHTLPKKQLAVRRAPRSVAPPCFLFLLLALPRQACNVFRLYNGKAAETELKALADRGHNLQVCFYNRSIHTTTHRAYTTGFVSSRSYRIYIPVRAAEKVNTLALVFSTGCSAYLCIS